MSTESILNNITDDQQLGRTVFENLYDLFRSMAKGLGGEISENDKFSRHITFPANPMFKGVWGTRLSMDEADGAIEEAISWFKARNAPFFFWWTGPETTPVDLPKRLQAHGLMDMAEQQQELARGIKQTELGAPCMVADLNKMNEEILSQTSEGFVIREIADEPELLDFKKVFVETYEIPEWAGQAWVDATLKIGIGKTPWRMFVGYMDNKPVATNMLFNGAGVASVYAVAVVPSARGKGIGGAITLKPLLEARDKDGYKYGVLFSTEMGVKVYERIGFRMTDVRINRYLWRSG
jgi:GNAT superfamily N-acetyltransferase